MQGCKKCFRQSRRLQKVWQRFNLVFCYFYVCVYQISVGALHSQAQNEFQERYDSEDDTAVVVSLPHMPVPEKLDIKSCEQFLLELFEQWMSPYIQPKTPLALLSEATKAVSSGVVISTIWLLTVVKLSHSCLEEWESTEIVLLY